MTDPETTPGPARTTDGVTLPSLPTAATSRTEDARPTAEAGPDATDGSAPPPAVEAGLPPRADAPSAVVPWTPPPAPLPAAGSNASGLALAALICSICGLAVVGVVLGHLALRDARDGRPDVRGLAVAALAVGYSMIGVTVIVLFVLLVVWVLFLLALTTAIGFAQ